MQTLGHVCGYCLNLWCKVKVCQRAVERRILGINVTKIYTDFTDRVQFRVLHPDTTLEYTGMCRCQTVSVGQTVNKNNIEWYPDTVRRGSGKLRRTRGNALERFR